MPTDSEYRYLRRNGRRFKMSRQEAAEALLLAGVPDHPVFVDFQTQFGGYAPEEDVIFGIVSPPDLPQLRRYNGEARSNSVGGLQFARCDLDGRNQLQFQIDENGVFYYGKTAVAESFPSSVRFQAYCSQTLEPLGWTHIDSERRATKRFQAFFDRLEKATVISSASDRYHSVDRSVQYFEISICGNRQHFVCPEALKQS